MNHAFEGMSRDKIIYLSAAFGSYLLYWIIIVACWKWCAQDRFNKKADLEENDFGLAFILLLSKHGQSPKLRLTKIQQELGECDSN